MMKMMGSFSASISAPKRQSDDRCVSAEKIIVQVVCQGVFVTVNNYFCMIFSQQGFTRRGQVKMGSKGLW